MGIFWGLEHYSAPEGGTAVTVGTFDGFHLGHKALVKRLAEIGRQHSLPTVAVTFDRHPLDIIAPRKAPALLNSARERAERLAASGAGSVVVLSFDEALCSMDAKSFVTDILLQGIGMKRALVGYNFTYGHGRTGSADTLAALGRELGFDVEVTPPVMVGGEPVSSSRIRSAVEAGDVRGAARMLGEYYRVRGEVAHGDGRGMEIGYPTANILTPERRALPGNGVYAVNARFKGMLLRGAANLGVRPTMVTGGRRQLEVHLIGYTGDLYGHELEVQFLERIRDEMKFSSVDELVQQIHRDISRSLEICDSFEPSSPEAPVLAEV